MTWFSAVVDVHDDDSLIIDDIPKADDSMDHLRDEVRRDDEMEVRVDRDDLLIFRWKPGSSYEGALVMWAKKKEDSQ